MFGIGSFQAVLGMDTSSYTRGILNAQGVTQVFGQSFATFISNPLLGGLQLFQRVGAAAIKMGAEILSAAESVERLGQRTGVTTDTIQALRAAMELAGFAADRADGSLVEFTKKLGEARTKGGEVAVVLGGLGISLASLGDTEADLRRVLDVIAAIEDPARRAATATALFGNTEVLNAIGGASDALDRLIERYRRTGQVTASDDIAGLARLNTQIGLTQQAIEGLARSTLTQFLAGFAGEVQLADESLEEFAGRLNEKVGVAARDAGQAVGELVGNLDDLLDRLNQLIAAPAAISAIGQSLVGVLNASPSIIVRDNDPERVARRRGEAPPATARATR